MHGAQPLEDIPPHATGDMADEDCVTEVSGARGPLRMTDFERGYFPCHCPVSPYQLGGRRRCVNPEARNHDARDRQECIARRSNGSGAGGGPIDDKLFQDDLVEVAANEYSDAAWLQ